TASISQVSQTIYLSSSRATTPIPPITRNQVKQIKKTELPSEEVLLVTSQSQALIDLEYSSS
ncbi:35033_t:CDS:1, partial [Racocetra persica]